ncbi:MAG: 1-(5-phosphoribosyl)-5-[Firmicutes bacterium]|nr:1-(5-phosphoribosyl)-5-[(5-phosphoribosylamino)methylideneamino]imidazole-4-carboxamide isomerase [Bacillota bacterium]
MLIFPAIDLYNGCAVRLLHGDYAQMTVYSENPLEVAADFAKCGAKWVHMVDLAGAKDGTTPHLPLVQQVKAETGLKVEVGGGIRSRETIAAYLDAGIDRVILGTSAITAPELLEWAVATYGERIAVGVDIKDGRPAIKGWLEQADITADELFERLQKLQVATVICTDISRDGAMRGANRELYADLAARYGMDIIASGGVSDMGDVRALHELGLYGAIIGRAYYNGAINLAEAVEAVQ